MIWNMLFILTCLAVLALSIYRYVKTEIDSRVRFFLITLRVLALITIITAFIEPEFVIERLASKDTPVPVLIDVSESMRLFKPDSSVIPFLDRMKALGDNGKRKFVFFIFGDSLRPLENKKPLFTDKKSFFPADFKSKLKRSTDLILISDGNWSNSSLHSSIFTEKNVRFIPLPEPVRSPFLQMNAEFPEQCRTGNQVTFKISVEGAVTKKSKIVLRISESGKSIISKDIDVDSGYFNKDIPVQMPASEPGAYLYRIDASVPEYSLHVQKFKIHQILPDKFSFTIYSSGLSLDKRFLTLAFCKDSVMIQNKNETDKTDCLLLFDYDRKAEEKIKTVKKTGLIVFAGCMPCSSSIIKSSTDSRLLIPQSNRDPVLNETGLERLPSPESIIKPAHNFIKGNCILSLVNKTGKFSDTSSIITISEFTGRKALIVAAKDFWRCDFWPLSVGSGEEDAFVFSNIIISHTEQILGSNLTNRYFAYPVDNSSSSLPVPFSILFPSGITSIGSLLDISFIFSGATRHDTTIQIFNSGASHTQIDLFSLSPGLYSFTSTIKSYSNFTYSDSVLVQPDNSENLVTSQNTAFLKEIGSPLSLDKLDTELSTGKDNSAPVIREPFRISRTWPLLIAIFMLFAGEWILRRAKGLD
jgi:hypothetical protein